ncbi:hypothetical protein MKX01_041391 [Papaver californicum]|nr:hypothetical protein MKX01_041391 [Papaver californicum]
MEDQNSTTNTTTSTINPYEALMVVHNPDDTLTRNLPVQITNTSDDPNSKDILLNAQHNTWIRIFKPTTIQDLPTTNKLPVIIYYHGGGFVLCSTFWSIYHDYCKSKATTLSAIVVSVEYRLAPESRLPAAYDDAVDALNWVKHQALEGKPCERWLRDYADFTKCYVMGESAGANIAYQVCLRASELDLGPVNISGLILNQPFMGGIERTSSELRLINDKILSLPVSDLMWELSLPIGSNRNHPYCTLMINEDDDESLRKKWEFIKKCLVIGCDGDPLIDRQVEFVKMLKGKGVKVETLMQEGGYHGMVYFEPKELEIMLEKLKDFIL